jgi:hypothetical protein
MINATLTELLSSCRIGDPIDLGGLRIRAVLREPGAFKVDAALLEESIGKKEAVVSEVNESGIVGCVRVQNSGDRVLLLVDGEEILGAKQNRIINSSFLVPPGETAQIPVSCVERRRWSPKSESFAPSGTTFGSSSRMRKLARISRALKAGAGYDADQSEVWREVDGFLASSGAKSQTAAYSDGYADKRSEIEQLLSRFEARSDQVGIAIENPDGALCVDVFGGPALASRALKKILRGAIIEAQGRQSKQGTTVPRTLAVLGDLDVERADAPGAGETWHGERDGRLLAAVLLDGMVYHAFGVLPA